MPDACTGWCRERAVSDNVSLRTATRLPVVPQNQPCSGWVRVIVGTHGLRTLCNSSPRKQLECPPMSSVARLSTVMPLHEAEMFSSRPDGSASIPAQGNGDARAVHSSRLWSAKRGFVRPHRAAVSGWQPSLLFHLCSVLKPRIAQSLQA